MNTTRLDAALYNYTAHLQQCHRDAACWRRAKELACVPERSERVKNSENILARSGVRLSRLRADAFFAGASLEQIDALHGAAAGGAP